MSKLFPARNKIAIVGFGIANAGRRPTESLGITALHVAREAINDAGLTVEQVDGFVSSSLLPSSGAHAIVDGQSVVTSDWMSRNLGARPQYVAGFQGVGQITGSMSLALNALASGAADYVLLHRALYNPPGKYNDNAMREVRGDQQWTAPQGFFGSLPAIALAYNEYNQRYGATREAMGRVVVEARRNGALNHFSHWRGKPITLEQYMAEPQIYDPMTKLDCDIPVQAVGAFVLTTAERARDLPNKPVHITSITHGYPSRHRLPLHWTLDDMMEAGIDTARRLWASSGFNPKDVKIAQFYDAFAPFVYIWLESLGFVPKGEAHRYVMDGGIDASNPNALAVLSGGGAIGNGRLHGLPQVLEVYLQLAGRAGDRQRKGEVGVSSYAAPHYGGAIAYSAASAV